MKIFVTTMIVLLTIYGYGQDYLEKGLHEYSKKDYVKAIYYWELHLKTTREKDIIWTNHTYFNISQAYHFLDSSKLSYVYLDSILQTDSSYDHVYVYQARALIHLKRYTSAIEKLDISLKRDMNVESALDTKASCFLDLKEWSACLDVIESYEAIFGYGDLSITVMKARCYYELGDYSKSAVAAEDAYLIKNTNSYNLITIVLLYGKVKLDLDFCAVVRSLELIVKEYQKSYPYYNLDEEVRQSITKIKTDKKC